MVFHLHLLKGSMPGPIVFIGAIVSGPHPTLEKCLAILVIKSLGWEFSVTRFGENSPFWQYFKSLGRLRED